MREKIKSLLSQIEGERIYFFFDYFSSFIQIILKVQKIKNPFKLDLKKSQRNL